MKTILALLFLAFSFLSFAGEDIPAPKGVVGDPETIEDAARVNLPSRTEISLNGLWRSRPIVDGEPADAVPAGDWGWAKIPAFLTRDGVGSALEDQETFYAPRFADEIGKSKEFAKSVHERRWYRRVRDMRGLTGDVTLALEPLSGARHLRLGRARRPAVDSFGYADQHKIFYVSCGA